MSIEELQEQNAALMEERDILIRVKRDQLAAMQKEIDAAKRVATDRLYMMEAYWMMLGPMGLKVAKMWKEKGVTRQHTSWGPDAYAMTGEERAKVLLDAEESIRRVDRVDGGDE